MFCYIYMKCIITKTEKLSGTCAIPGSKSEAIRALFLAALAEGKSEIKNFPDCDDTNTALGILSDLGIPRERKGKSVIVHGRGLSLRIKSKKINTGNSGITTRFALPLLGFRENTEAPVIFDCGNQMRRRPIAPLVNALNDLGMAISFLKKRGTCPLKVTGALLGGRTMVDGITSQYLSALLLSLPLAKSDSVVRVGNLHERPYVAMTLECLANLGVVVSHQKVRNMDVYNIKGQQKYSNFKKSIPGDFSSTSCLLVAGCILGGKIILEGLESQSRQGDKKLIAILQKMGADIKIARNKVIIHGGRKLRGISIDANDIPDLVPALAVVATQATGKTKIHNVPQARLKETDRIKSMSQGLRRMGVRVEEHKDGLIVYQSKLRGSVINGYGDHRTVMAFTVAGMLAEGRTVISGAEAVDKTFPEFYQLVKNLGAKIKVRK